MQALLTALRAVGESTRLRLLALCSRAELSVSDLTQILAMSQPGISRHLRLLCEAGLLERSREGTWAFYRLARSGKNVDLASALAALIPEDDEIARDLARLEEIQADREASASAYFRSNAGDWNRIRSLHVDDREVEEALKGLFTKKGVENYLDIGTGTGRMLELFGPRVGRGTGLDLSHEMLMIARAALEKAGLRNCALQQGDMYALPWHGQTFDAVTLHQVLHYADDPAAVLIEAGRVLRPGGFLLLVDFAPHGIENLRKEHAHRRLGFADDEIAGWCQTAGLKAPEVTHLHGASLTVMIWKAVRATPGVTISEKHKGGKKPHASLDKQKEQGASSRL
ncbi:MAG: metalloregulator ArsR/SmtB family transcription factor [Rhodospirillaceae bacterium]|jgi:ubiquinone/menaquinone biosynthesis C-methylase UbiE|nr:metalloregulator ArsR/SmtB family transcription factor [Rhodospirillaceae bacterium]MBT5374450.1 metalloregulator ArsR/SmtB family transcription factor [Rhodospirillaceae bacterium]MBT5659890.1 metalloregulator ArsR/SmtB family transcription factor [Rhodospirillaceae bacterium]MBT5752524.1 metalloregulator ArsR/SmtB family transcription factor [Rhodospirillaceae bacterium]